LIVFDMLLDLAAPCGEGWRMSSWSQFEQQAPELAASVRTRLDAHVHKTIATLRRDGSPRISGTECRFADGELWIGSMWQALKARDLQRDPRYALHSGSDDPPEWPGDAKLSGVVEEITDPEVVQRMNGEVTQGPSHLFRLDVQEASIVGLNETRDRIVIELWRPGASVRRIERE
jgi:Pyridoxamine 5'-phosphate oxidase